MSLIVAGTSHAPGHDLIRDAVVARRAIIAFAAQPTVDQAVGLKLAYHVGKLAGALLGHEARRVKPDQTQRAILRQQFAHLRKGLVAQVLIEILLVIRAEIPGVSRTVGFVPILRLRIVETEFDAAFGAGRLQLLHRITFERRGIDDVVAARLRFEHGKAVVMLRRDRQVFHSRVCGELCPLIGVEFDRIELSGKLFVLLHRNLRAIHDPFADARNLLSLPGSRRNRV